jgi:hypothetical protein
MLVLVGVIAFAVAGYAAECAKAAAPVAKNIVAIKDGVAYQCDCACGSTCTLSADGKTCSAGKAVEKVDLTGKFVCEKCKVVADKAGKCTKCEADLVEVKAKAPAEAK